MIANLGKEKKIVEASLFKRFVAFILDILILDLIVFSAFSGTLSKYFSWSSLDSLKDGFPFALSALLLLLGLLAFVYFTLMEYGIGKTPGMMIVGIRVDGTLSFWSCALRNIFVIPIFPLTVLWLIEPLYLIFRKRRLTESLTGTNTILDD